MSAWVGLVGRDRKEPARERSRRLTWPTRPTFAGSHCPAAEEEKAGRTLLDHIHRLAAEHLLAGVTPLETPANLSLYEHFDVANRLAKVSAELETGRRPNPGDKW
jgi:hypothetical protein